VDRNPNFVAHGNFRTCGLFLTQIAVVFHLGGRTVGGLLGNLIQLLLGLLCVLSAVQAFRRSGATGEITGDGWPPLSRFGLWRKGWNLPRRVPLAFNASSRILTTCCSSVRCSPRHDAFLDADHEPSRFDRLHLLDFLQVCAFWGSAYLFFPRGYTEQTMVGWGKFGWTPSLLMTECWQRPSCCEPF